MARSPDKHNGEVYLMADYRALSRLSADEVHRARWLASGRDIGKFADEAARWARRHGNLDGFALAP